MQWIKTWTVVSLFLGYFIPFMLSVVMHCLLIIVLLIFDGSSHKTKLIAPVPSHMNASLVQMPKNLISNTKNRNQHNKLRNNNQTKLSEEIVLNNKASKNNKSKTEAEKKRNVLLEKLSKQEKAWMEQQKALERKQLETHQLSSRELEIMRRLEQKHQNKNAKNVVLDKQAEEIAHYSSLLDGLISRYWRPPSMMSDKLEVIVQVRLSRYGDILEAKFIVKSSHVEFNQSALDAINKAAPFSELKKMDRTLFEKAFQYVNFRFKPSGVVR